MKKFHVTVDIKQRAVVTVEAETLEGAIDVINEVDLLDDGEIEADDRILYLDNEDTETEVTAITEVEEE